MGERQETEASVGKTLKYDWSEESKRVFREWDKDNCGFISRRGLTQLVQQLAGNRKISEREMDHVMAEADANGNGRIEYEEFLEWIARPATTVRMGSEGLEFFDLEEVLKPLYQAYDRNDDGQVSMEEFLECQTILRNSLSLRSTALMADDAPKTGVLLDDSLQTFTRVDLDHSGGVSFYEFCEWQRTELNKGGVQDAGELKALLPTLARQMKRIFNFSDLGRETNAVDEQVLHRIIDSLATTALDLYNEHGKPAESATRRIYTNRWSEPPVGLNIPKLKAKFLATCSRPSRRDEQFDLDLLVVPGQESGGDPSALKASDPSRPWHAEIILKAKRADGAVRIDKPVFFTYSQKDLCWTRDEDQVNAASVFERQVDEMPSELLMFCILKVEANFGIQLTWAQTERSLQRAQERGIITRRHVMEYTAWMEMRLLTIMKEEDLIQDLESKQEASKQLDRMRDAVKQRPREVMATLSDMEMFKVSPVWADFMK